MVDLGETRRRSGADPPRRRIVGSELGMQLLERLELVIERVVAGVGDLGVVEDVVAVGVMLDQPP